MPRHTSFFLDHTSNSELSVTVGYDKPMDSQVLAHGFSGSLGTSFSEEGIWR